MSALDNQFRKSQTDELAGYIQRELMHRQAALLRIPEVVYEIVSDLSAATSAKQNSFVNILEAVLVDDVWSPVSQLSHEFLSAAVSDLIRSIGFSFGSMVEAKMNDWNSCLPERQIASVSSKLQLNDLYLRKFFPYRDELAYCGVSSIHYEHELGAIVESFDNAQMRLDAFIEEMMVFNEPAFKSIIRPYMTGSFNSDDLMAEAYTGFYRACVKYNPCAGVNFYGFLQRWVVARVVAYIDRESSILSVGGKSGSTFRKIRSVRANLGANGKVVSTAEVAKHAGLSVCEVEAFESSFQPWGNQDDVEFNNVSSEVQTPEEAIDEADRRKLVSQLLAKLNPRETQVIIGRYGIGCAEKTLSDLGDALGVSAEMVRQIQRQAEAKMGEIARGLI